MYMFHFISQDALEVINWVTGCLKEPTGDCDAFFLSWCCRDCGSGHGDYDIDGSNNCNYYFAARAPSIPAMSERKGFFHGRSSLKYRVLSSWYLSASRWGTDQMEIRKYDLLAYLFTDGRTDWGAGDAYASKKLTDPLTHCSSFRRRYFKISFASKTKRTWDSWVAGLRVD